MDHPCAQHCFFPPLHPWPAVGSSVTYVQRKTGAEKNNQATRISGKRRGEKEQKGDARDEKCVI